MARGLFEEICSETVGSVRNLPQSLFGGKLPRTFQFSRGLPINCLTFFVTHLAKFVFDFGG
jgi:hypothetical protein